jgi:hypothetical protein
MKNDRGEGRKDDVGTRERKGGTDEMSQSKDENGDGGEVDNDDDDDGKRG